MEVGGRTLMFVAYWTIESVRNDIKYLRIQGEKEIEGMFSS